MYYEVVTHCRCDSAAGWSVVYLPYGFVVYSAGENVMPVGVLSNARQISSLQVESELLYMHKHYGRLGLAFHMALLGLGDGIVGLKQIVKRWLGSAAKSHRQTLLAPKSRVFKVTVRATHARY